MELGDFAILFLLFSEGPATVIGTLSWFHGQQSCSSVFPEIEGSGRAIATRDAFFLDNK